MRNVGKFWEIWKFHLAVSRSRFCTGRRILGAFFNFCRSEEIGFLRRRSRIICALRASRIFFFLHEHVTLARSNVFVNHLLPFEPYALFHHMSRRYYLAKNLSLRERVNILGSHYRIEDTFFDDDYKRHVYSLHGLTLWKSVIAGTEFQVRIKFAECYASEGDLGIILTVDGERLHTIFFSWLTGTEDSEPGAKIFIGLNQGSSRRRCDLREKFTSAFPLSSPNFACYSALQGLAQAVGSCEMRAVSGRQQVCYSPDEVGHFKNAYDRFWEAVGGRPDGLFGYILPVPQPMKLLSEFSAKHRSRAAKRRALLNAISNDAFRVVAAHNCRILM